MDHLDIDVSNAKSLPTVPPLFSAATPDGDLVIIRNGEFFSNPKGREVVEETRKKDADPKKNIFCEMKTLCLERPQAVEPSAAEKLALKLATEEIESKRSIQTESETLQVEKECGICTEEGFQVALSSCGHFSCVQCWTSYVTHAIHDNRVPMRCFGEKCLEVIPVPVVQSFVHQELVRRYEKQLVNRRLLQDDFLFCKRCEKFLFLATSPTASSRIVICDCGASWCRGCREEAHEPLSCENMRKYEDMLQRSGQSFHNVSLAHVANGVKCPKCAGLIDRTTGCNHMECICGYEFCYACREPFAGSHYDCGTDAREDFALIDGAETVHLGVFQKCILLRRKRSADSLLEMQRRLEKGVSAEKVKALLDRFQQLLEFLERALVHRFLSYGRVRFKSGHFLAQQFGSLEDRLQFLLNRSEVEKGVSKMEAMLGSALRICDSLNERCMRM
uniref:RBR-type E3 ubiquitin transferase n=1 Tax=Steinernema glaseri TaxID=37863 RepID=A0A1I7ZQ63_9BILA